MHRARSKKLFTSLKTVQCSEGFFESTLSHENVSKADLNNKLCLLWGEKSHISQVFQTASSLLYHFSHYSLWPYFSKLLHNYEAFCLLKYLSNNLNAFKCIKILTKWPNFTLALNHIYFTYLEWIFWFQCISGSGHSDCDYMLHCVWHYKKALIVGPIVGKILCRIYSAKKQKMVFFQNILYFSSIYFIRWIFESDKSQSITSSK